MHQIYVLDSLADDRVGRHTADKEDEGPGKLFKVGAVLLLAAGAALEAAGHARIGLARARARVVELGLRNVSAASLEKVVEDDEKPNQRLLAWRPETCEMQRE